MTSIQLFNFKDKQIRTIIKDWELWFIAKDVATVLWLAWSWWKTLRKIPKEWVDYTPLWTQGGEQQSTIINEPWVYILTFRSNKELAVEFKIFVAQIITKLRKWETVSLKQQTPAQALLESVQLLVKHEEEIKDLQIRADILESKFVNRSEDYYSMAWWCNLNKFWPYSSNELKIYWMKARKLSDSMEVEVKFVSDEKWGKVNIYHKSILEKILLN